MTDSLLYYNPIKAPVKPWEPFHQLMILTGPVSLIDRTDTLDIPLRCQSIFPIPKGNCSDSFSDLCDLRAIHLLERAEKEGKKLQVLWSGGIDSTTALVALLRNGNPDLIVVAMSSHSIEENPFFYRNHILSKIEHHPKTIRSIQMDDVINVTGELGDQVFGSIMTETLIATHGEEAITKPWREEMPAYFADRLGKDNDVFDYLQPLIAACPAELKTAADYLWWLNFSLKWQDVSLRICTGLDIDARQFLSSTEHFFSSDDFQLWSLANVDKHIGTTWKSYKHIAKGYIHAFDKNDDYRDNKVKVGSLQNISAPMKYSGLRSDFTFIPASENLNRYRKDNEVHN